MGDGQAVGRADVDAGVALDARALGEVGLDVAVETSPDLLLDLLDRVPLLDLELEVLEAFVQVHVNHLLPRDRVVVVFVRPLVQAHLGAGQGLAFWGPLRDGLPLAVLVDRDRGLVPMLHRPDDVGGAERGVATEEHPRLRGHERRFVHDRHVPLAELQAHVALDEREGVFLPDGQDDGVARDDLVADGGLHQLAVHVLGGEDLKLHPDELAALDHESDRADVLADRHLLLFGVL
jgi:hypothetical protein